MRKTLGFVLLVVAAAFPASAVAGDWTHWRGPEGNGAVRWNAAVTSWSQAGENLLWKAAIGGRTTPMVHNGRVFLITPIGEGAALQERVICLDANSGKTLWQDAFGVYHTDIVENRVGWTALAVDPDTGNVYAHTTGGDLRCYSADGKLLWDQPLTESFGRFSGYGGRLYTPIVDEDRVILSFIGSSWGDQASLSHRFVAFDKRDGRVVWDVAPGGRPLDTTYATPAVAVIDGRRLLICPAADGWVYALQARTGQTVWKYQFAARPINVSPVIDGDRIYLGHSEENLDTTAMGRVACISGKGTGDITQTAELWRVDDVDAGYATPALVNNRLYVIDNAARLHCFDAADGKRLWDFELGRIGRGSPVVTADGVIYAGEQNGNFFILRDSGDKPEVLQHESFEKVNGAINEIQGTPSLVDGRVYFQTRYSTYCLAPKQPPAEPAKPRPEPKESTGDSPMVGFLLVPRDITLSPGEAVKFELRPYNAAGQYVSPSVDERPQWSLAGAAGTLKDWSFTAAADNKPSAGVVTVKIGEMQATARVRVCPKLPFSENFEALAADGAPPGWLNVVGKAKVVERDGGKVLAHLAEKPTPIFMRIRTFMTPPISGGYTIQADLLGGKKKPHWKPDMGLVNSRYELLLLGSEPVLRITSWSAIPRLQKDVPFEWHADTWYTARFEVRYDGGKALLRGKVWPRDQKEPAGWTVELTDDHPNFEGSPALYGYAAGTTAKSKGCEILYDNVSVTAGEGQSAKSEAKKP